jgi:hypothetical protein
MSKEESLQLSFGSPSYSNPKALDCHPSLFGKEMWKFANASNRQENLGVGATSPLAGHHVWVGARYAFNPLMIYTS